MKKTVAAALCVLLCCTGCGQDSALPDKLTPPETTASSDGGFADTTTQAATTTQTTTTTPTQTTQITSALTALTEPTSQTTTVTTKDAAALAAAEAECERCLAAVNSASAAAQNAQSALNAAQGTLTAAEQSRDSYRAAHQTDLDMYSQGSLGFFTFVGAADAVDALRNATYASSTVFGSSTDATSLENMRKTFDFMRECNNLRASEGLSALRVTDKMMAIAQSNLNWSDKNVQHSMQFHVGENLAWNYPDPFKGWYDEEKADRGGHYLNIVNSSYQITGFAVCTAGRSGSYSVSHGQVFGFAYGETTYTVDEYEQRLNQYVQSISDISAQMSALTSAAETAKTQVQNCTATLTQAQSAYTAAQQAYQNAQAAYELLK